MKIVSCCGVSTTLNAWLLLLNASNELSPVIQVAHLSNEFYQLMPRSGFEFERIPILDTSDAVQKEWKNVETLLELEVASKIMAGALYRVKGRPGQEFTYL